MASVVARKVREDVSGTRRGGAGVLRLGCRAGAFLEGMRHSSSACLSFCFDQSAHDGRCNLRNLFSRAASSFLYIYIYLALLSVSTLRTMSVPLQYAPWTSDIELAFYNALAKIKIDHDKLDSSARKVLGLYEIQPKDAPERSSRMQIHGTALTTDE